MAESSLIPEQRYELVLSALLREGIVSIRSLAERLDVSHMTVRRDIAQLEAQGRVVRVKGGVRLSAESGGQNVPLEINGRVDLEVPRKKAIASTAASHIEVGSTVYLDAGTTAQAMVPFISTIKQLTVITNDFLIVNALFSYPEIVVIHTGGNVDATAGCAEGPLAADLVSRLNIDEYFVSTAGWSLSKGVTAPSTDKALLKQAVLAASSRATLIADSTKYGAAAMIKAIGIEALDSVITDDGLAKEKQDLLREAGIELEVCALEQQHPIT